MRHTLKETTRCQPMKRRETSGYSFYPKIESFLAVQRIISGKWETLVLAVPVVRYTTIELVGEMQHTWLTPMIRMSSKSGTLCLFNTIANQMVSSCYRISTSTQGWVLNVSSVFSRTSHPTTTSTAFNPYLIKLPNTQTRAHIPESWEKMIKI